MPESARDADNWYQAAGRGNIKKAEACVADGQSIDAQHPHSRTTALMEAARGGHYKMMEWLLERGANPSLQAGPQKFTALHLTIMHGHARCAQLLLAYNANIALQDALDRTPLHHTITSDAAELSDLQRLSLIRHLLTFASPIDATDIEGATALHYCAIYGRTDAAKLLLEHGADPNKTTRECSLTPCHIAVVEGLQDMILIMVEHGANTDLKTAQGWSVRSRYPDLCRIPPGKQTQQSAS